MSLEAASRIADAVLYEGYLLYPYRASAQKNRMRWQFGVLMPHDHSELAGERWAAQTEVLVATVPDATLHVRARFLQLETRSGPDGSDDWDEGVEREVDVVVRLTGERDGRVEESGSIQLPAAEERDGDVVRRRCPIEGRVIVTAEQLPAAEPLTRLRVRVENLTAWRDTAATRDDALRRSLVGAHVLLAVTAGRFLSLVDPPGWASADAAACRSDGMWPVLVGDADAVVLSAPIILEDHPQIAPESTGDMFDASEMDEILSLRTLTLTDAEKQEARATDPRAAALLDRVEAMPAGAWARLHGAVRRDGGDAPPWWDPGADASVSPEADTVDVGGVAVGRGSRVRLVPGPNADAQDLFLRDRTATVEAVFADVDEGRQVAVTLDDDPGADLQRANGRFLYFRPEEVEPL